ncbi:MAG: formate--tetrahydrofolate ligase [Bacilli bacterium]
MKENNMDKIEKVASLLGIQENVLFKYGSYKAKIPLEYYDEIKNNPTGKLVLVTAITPTKAGEGKTTSSIGLVNGLRKIGIKATVVLREPSLGPVFGLKGGAIGGGKSIIVPSEDINLHFNGDMHALTSSINLISAIIDNHLFQGNELNIDPTKIVWKRSLDMNDRALREIVIGLGEKNGVERKESFQITVASELMAVLCLATSRDDFKHRVGEIIVAYTYEDNPVYVKDLKIVNAIMKLMNDALSPNLVQTLYGNPCIVHGGPFANIAHGCNSLIATKMALKLSDVVVTEAGFGADLGAEKFFDIKCRVGKLQPDAVVLVATIRALKLHGGVAYEDLNKENIEALKIGIKNLNQHIENLKKFEVPLIVAINHFASDSESEIKVLKNWCLENNCEISFLNAYIEGPEGAVDLANKVAKVLNTKETHYHPLYDLDLSIKDKIEKICRDIYRAKNINYTPEVEEKIKNYVQIGKANLPICIAKTPMSFSDNPKLLNAPSDYDILVKDINLNNGAGFIVAYLGNILTMPGLPKVPQAVMMENEDEQL